MSIDVAAVRAETPGCREVVHVNNAGAALPPRPVLDSLIEILEQEAHLGGYETAEANQARITHTYTALARLIGADPDEIAYAPSATQAWDSAFYAIPFAPGDRILTTTSEYASNVIAFRHVAERRGVEIAVVPDDTSGTISLDALHDMLDARVKLVAINHVPTDNGLVNPAAEVGRLARAAGALYLLDACQSIGQLAVDVREVGCDLLSATGRKFLRAPRGTGFLYVRRDVLDRLDPPFLDVCAARLIGPDSYEMRADARRFESFERTIAGHIALGVAAEYAHRLGTAAIERRVTALAETLRTRLADIPGVRVRDRGARRCGIVTFTCADRDPRTVVMRLRARRVNVWAVPSAAPDGRGAPGVVRASVHYYNTEEEIDRVVAAIAALRD